MDQGTSTPVAIAGATGLFRRYRLDKFIHTHTYIYICIYIYSYGYLLRVLLQMVYYDLVLILLIQSFVSFTISIINMAVITILIILQG